ncbi:hypothetical protein CCB80_00275 [Armatimonadetes bacterium Uphvl-Ar1]|nr:hypothetical protein CCB80_00275 [Armatimonadetes bacterium Uphvl-Ar1]
MPKPSSEFTNSLQISAGNLDNRAGLLKSGPISIKTN